MAEGTTAIDLALETEGDADGTDLIEFGVGAATPTPTPTGQLQYIDDHEERAARKLAPPFWGKPVIAAVLAALTREIQALEDTLWEMLELRTVDNADLARLKVLGKIVGQPRLGFSTENYRLLVRARALANVSRGRASDIIAVLELLVGPGDYTLIEAGDATLLVSVEVSVSEEGLAMLQQILPDTRAAGVGLQLLYASDVDEVFVWGDAWADDEEWGGVTTL